MSDWPESEMMQNNNNNKTIEQLFTFLLTYSFTDELLNKSQLFSEVVIGW